MKYVFRFMKVNDILYYTYTTIPTTLHFYDDTYNKNKFEDKWWGFYKMKFYLSQAQTKRIDAETVNN
jgi:hypothetical protein